MRRLALSSCQQSPPADDAEVCLPPELFFLCVTYTAQFSVQLGQSLLGTNGRLQSQCVWILDGICVSLVGRRTGTHEAMRCYYIRAIDIAVIDTWSRRCRAESDIRHVLITWSKRGHVRSRRFENEATQTAMLKLPLVCLRHAELYGSSWNHRGATQSGNMSAGTHGRHDVTWSCFRRMLRPAGGEQCAASVMEICSPCRRNRR